MLEARGLLEKGGMQATVPISEALLDLLVPANLASRYRARVMAVTACEARLRLPFRPSLFRKGIVSSCPAQLTLAVNSHVVRIRGIFHAEDADDPTFARFCFAEPITQRDFEILRWTCEPDLPIPDAMDDDSLAPVAFAAS